MSREITEGLALRPAAFSAGLPNWSSGDGTIGAPSYNGAGNAALVPGDQDFGTCLELIKTDAVQKLRAFANTPILPGLYLRVRAKVKAVSGALPAVRIAAWAGIDVNTHATSLVETGSAVTLTQYGEVVTVEAIIGTGARTGVTMAWPTTVTLAHVGLDLTGANGGVVRIDDIEVEDVSSFWQYQILARVDVRDFGAKGDGVTDDRAAFNAADGAADGKVLFVPAGTYYLSDNITIDNPIVFEGKVTLPAAKRIVLRANFDLPSYVSAFGGDETEGFKRALQALFNFTDHDSLDMKGRRIDVSAPINVQAAEGSITTFEVRRVVRNGMLNVVDGPAWAPGVVTSQANYSTANPTVLTNVANLSTIEVGALVTGTGVGREVYVTSKNIGANSLTLSLPLYGPAGTQTYTFTRNRYVLDFSGFERLSKFTLSDIEIQCNGYASAILLAPAGETFHLRNAMINKPAERGVTSHGRGCQDLQIDGCHFNSDETALAATARSSIAFNVNANDAKIRSNRFQRFRHTGVLYGTGHLIVANHWFQGDEVTAGPRLSGMILTLPSSKTVITGNYIDNASIELTNEHDATPDLGSEYSFGGLAITGNIFATLDAAAWFTWIIIKPYGTGHFIQGLSVQGNMFRTVNGNIDRVEKVDTSIATLDFGRTRNVVFEGNTFNGVNQLTQNPVTLEFNQATASKNWTLDFGAYLPFSGWARTVECVSTEGAMTNASNVEVYTLPYATPNFGSNGNQVRLTWSEAVKGRVQVTARVDHPV